MNIIIGILLIIILISEIYVLMLLTDFKKNSKKEVEVKVIEKPKEPKLTDEQKKKQEELKKAFGNLMNYDYDEALRKKE